MEVLQKKKSLQKYSIKVKREIDIGIGHLFKTSREQVPGYLSVKIDNLYLDYGTIEFFGVSEEGAYITGRGVAASQVAKDKDGEIIALFNISRLIKSGQFSEETVEGVIMADNQELGRDSININPAIYLG